MDHDTLDFLRKLEGINGQIPNTAIIGTFDVSSLYTNIPHKEGIHTCSAALAKAEHTSPPLSDMASLMKLLLTLKPVQVMIKIHVVYLFSSF